MKKKVLFCSGLIVLMLVLAACGGGQPAASSTESAGGAMTPQKGGSMIIAYKDDLATLDPAIGYDWTDRKSTRLNSSHIQKSRMPSSA